MEDVDELNAVFSERFTAAVDEWISLKRKTDGSKYSKLDLASLLHTHCGYSKSCLYRWIEGNGMPTLPNLLCTAKFFNKDLSFFIDKDWSITRVRELINGEAQFKFDTRLLGLGKTGELRFWVPKGDQPPNTVVHHISTPPRPKPMIVPNFDKSGFTLRTSCKSLKTQLVS